MTWKGFIITAKVHIIKLMNIYIYLYMDNLWKKHHTTKH